MSLGTYFDLLSQIIEQYESEGGSVQAIEATMDDRAVRAIITLAVIPDSDDGHKPMLVAESASVNDEGGVEVSFSASRLIDVMERSEAAINAEVRGASSTDDGELVLTVEVVIGTSTDASEVTTTDGTDVNGTQLAAGEGSTGGEKTAENGVEAFDGGDKTDGDRTGTAGCVSDGPTPSSLMVKELTAVRDESIPPYEDIDYLEQLYERCETFTEMTQLIEMDVASETVRRYMIEAGIHTPTSYDTATQTQESESEESKLGKPDTGEPNGRKPDTDSSTAHGADADSSETDSNERRELEGDSSSEATPEPSSDAVSAEKLVTDGIGLPNRVQIPDVIDAVVASVTLYGFARRLDLEQEDARELLRQLNLLDFVPRRLPAGRKRKLSHEDVAERIRRSAGSA